MGRRRTEKNDLGGLPDMWPNRGNSAYESIRRGTRVDSQVQGTRSRGLFRSGETTNDLPKSEVVDYAENTLSRFRQSLFACRAWLRVVVRRDGGMLGGCQSVRGDGCFFVPEACFLGEFGAKVSLRWLSRHCFGSGEVYVTDQ